MKTHSQLHAHTCPCAGSDPGLGIEIRTPGDGDAFKVCSVAAIAREEGDARRRDNSSSDTALCTDSPCIMSTVQNGEAQGPQAMAGLCRCVCVCDYARAMCVPLASSVTQNAAFARRVQQCVASAGAGGKREEESLLQAGKTLCSEQTTGRFMGFRAMCVMCTWDDETVTEVVGKIWRFGC